MTTKKLAAGILFATVLSGTVASAASLDNVQFLKIAPQDARAVVKGADGKLQIIKPGDKIGETVTVREISAGRIVLEERTDKGPAKVIVRIENDKQRIERFTQQAESKTQPVVPTTMQTTQGAR